MTLPIPDFTPQIQFPIRATATGPITNDETDISQGHIGIKTVTGGSEMWYRPISDLLTDPVPDPILLRIFGPFVDFDENLTPVSANRRIDWDEDEECPSYYNTTVGSRVQIGRETRLPLSYNKTGVTIPNGKAVCVTSSFNSKPSVCLADSNDYSRDKLIAFSTAEVLNDALGEFTRFGIINDVDTSSFTAGDILYLDTTPGEITNVRPVYPARPIIVGNCIVSDATIGSFIVVISPDLYDYAFDGCVIEPQDTTVVVDGGNAYLDVELIGGGDLPVQLGGDIRILDCTTGAGVGGKARVLLTPGLDTAPVKNYIYVEMSGTTAILSASTTQPTTSFAPIARVSLWSVAKTSTDNAAMHRRQTDSKVSNTLGRIAHIDDRLRDLGATWKSGVNPTATISTNIGTLDGIDFEILAGIVKQLHRQTMPALQVSVDGIFVANASGSGSLTKDQKITDLNQCLETASGVAISVNRRFNLIIFGMINKSSAECKLYVNLPTDDYGTDEAAYRDTSLYSPTSVDSAISENAFLIARIPLLYTVTSGGTFEFINPVGSTEIVDLRGVSLNVSASGVGGASGATQMIELNDVAFSSLTEGDELVYSSALWINRRPINKTLYGITTTSSATTVTDILAETLGGVDYPAILDDYKQCWSVVLEAESDSGTSQSTAVTKRWTGDIILVSGVGTAYVEWSQFTPVYTQNESAWDVSLTISDVGISSNTMQITVQQTSTTASTRTINWTMSLTNKINKLVSWGS